MKELFFYLFLCFLPLIGFSQEQNFINVSGFSDLTIQSESIRLTLQLTEIQRNEYNKIREKSIDEILEDLDANLKSIGSSRKDIVEVWPPNKNSNYKTQNTIKYYFYAKNVEEAKNVARFQVKGLKLMAVKYYYPEDIEIDFEVLAKQALENAQEKADFLAKRVNKKLGKIINISDQSQPLKDLNNNYTTEESTTITYKLNVTYELLD